MAGTACLTQKASRASSLVTGPLGTLSQPNLEALGAGPDSRDKKYDCVWAGRGLPHGDSGSINP